MFSTHPKAPIGAKEFVTYQSSTPISIVDRLFFTGTSVFVKFLYPLLISLAKHQKPFQNQLKTYPVNPVNPVKMRFCNTPQKYR